MLRGSTLTVSEVTRCLEKSAYTPSLSAQRASVRFSSFNSSFRCVCSISGTWLARSDHAALSVMCRPVGSSYDCYSKMRALSM
jgi:hypothetical protein